MRIQKSLFSWIICGVATVFWAGYAAAPVNPRAIESDSTSRQSADVVQSRVASVPTTRVRGGNVSTRAATVGGGATRVRTATTAVTPRENTLAGRIMARSSAPTAVSRVARSLKMGNARAGKNMSSSPIGGMARSGVARATAVFNDLGKIGSGYAACRESYATCMDQMCAMANDTYRRCFCSDRFTQFRDIENALDRAMIMLQQFQDNNLNAVDKTAAEVNAMYSATVGEQAIKKDTSGAAKMLDEINDLLSGKKTTGVSSSSTSLGVLDLDFSSDLDDIWSGDGSSLFSSEGQDLSTLEGAALFNAAQKQCVRLTKNNCENDAVFSMSKSSYNILITQDCNVYEKTLNKKRETVASAVREAERYLREARLEEYRSHNSADVNECIAKVRVAMLADTACGENYKRCLDPTGAYVNGATGEPIYSPRLFQLEKTIKLEGVTSSETVNTDILGQNKDYDKFLENYRKYVTRELDTCRDIADFVWTEFKRNAVIEIAQAQSAKIEEVKASCVDTIAECYDTTTQSLVNFDKNTATAAGALGRYASADMCHEQVIACAMLYAPNDNTQCQFDGRGHLTNSTQNCGLQALLNYVSTVDDLNVVEKCSEAIDEYVTKLCTPEDGNSYGYPYNCRRMTSGDRQTEEIDWTDNMNVEVAIKNYAISNCMKPTNNPEKKTGREAYDLLENTVKTKVGAILADVRYAIRESLGDVCESLGGHWFRDVQPGANAFALFYNTVSGRGSNDPAIASWGYCYENSEKIACESYNSADEDSTTMTRWDSATETCTFYDAWYKQMCEGAMGGYWDTDTCYVP
ncbi:MAG: hypothetical protein J6T57_03525 [Alphaproteobacteria bacterium]|nr:hypothetical protein [Alphaproteobacteria bacterium]